MIQLLKISTIWNILQLQPGGSVIFDVFIIFIHIANNTSEEKGTWETTIIPTYNRSVFL